jgi:DNA-binding transcriptional LysR family regulator
VDLIEEGYDLALRVGALADSRVVVRRLAPSRRVLLASPQYLARRAAPRSPRQLGEHACLVLDIGSHPQRWELVSGRATCSQEVRGPMHSNNTLALLGACRGGLGIALLPEFVATAALRDGTLRRVLPTWASPEQAIFAVYPTARFIPAKVRAFVEFVAQRLRGVGAPRGAPAERDHRREVDSRRS